MVLKAVLEGTVLISGVKRTFSTSGMIGSWLIWAATKASCRSEINIIWEFIIISMGKWLILLALVAGLTLAIDEGDRVNVSDLPINELLVKDFYAGYLKVYIGKALFYVYTPSANNPSKDPLMVIISPGPGCSSLRQWLYYQSEFIFVRNTTNFTFNSHEWNKMANVLYIEGPAGTGFSYGPSDNATDNTTTFEYYKAILSFYEKFPELKDQRMYLSGLGYAGIIVPKLALHIINHNRDPDTAAWLRLNISGILLMNPCTYAEECDSHFEFNQYTVRALRNNFFIDKAMYESYRSNCTLRTPNCAWVEQKIASDFKDTGADLRNLFMECLNQKGDYGCIDHLGIDIWLNDNGVKEDLHADKTRKWEFCNSTLQKNYTRDPSGSLYTYETLLRVEHNLKIWIISGTQSAVIPTFGTKRWVDEVKFNLRLPTTRVWQAWFYKNINAGEIESIPGLTLITIRSAGYYMFEDQPEISFHVYSSFLSGATL